MIDLFSVIINTIVIAVRLLFALLYSIGLGGRK